MCTLKITQRAEGPISLEIAQTLVLQLLIDHLLRSPITRAPLVALEDSQGGVRLIQLCLHLLIPSIIISHRFSDTTCYVIGDVEEMQLFSDFNDLISQELEVMKRATLNLLDFITTFQSVPFNTTLLLHNYCRENMKVHVASSSNNSRSLGIPEDSPQCFAYHWLCT